MKSIWQSRTFWVNLVTVAVSILGFIQAQDWIAHNPALVAIFGAILGVLNIILRTITDEPVKIFSDRIQRRFTTILIFAVMSLACAAPCLADDGAYGNRLGLGFGKLVLFAGMAIGALILWGRIARNERYVEVSQPARLFEPAGQDSPEANSADLRDRPAGLAQLRRYCPYASADQLLAYIDKSSKLIDAMVDQQRHWHDVADAATTKVTTASGSSLVRHTVTCPPGGGAGLGVQSS